MDLTLPITLCVIIVLAIIVLLIFVFKPDEKRPKRSADAATPSILKQQMVSCIKDLMLEYIENNHGTEDAVIPVFDSARAFVLKSSDKELSSAIHGAGLPMDAAVLNILQNHAMVNMKKIDMTSYMMGEGTEVFDLYNHINDLKLSKGYISSLQHKQNADLANRLTITPPGGMWL